MDSSSKSSQQAPGQRRELASTKKDQEDELLTAFLDTPGVPEIFQSLDLPRKSTVLNQLRAISTHSNAVAPILCRGERKCPYRETCPFVKIRSVPANKQCPVEQQIIATSLQRHLQEFGVDAYNTADMSLVNRLVEIELLEYRARSTFASEFQTILVKEPVGCTPSGIVLEKLAPSPILKVQERLTTEKLNILGQLVGTRKEKYKKDAALKQHSENDYSVYVSDMALRLRELTEKIKREKEKAEKEEKNELHPVNDKEGK